MMNEDKGVGEDFVSFKPKALLGIRHVQIVLLFFAMLLAFSMRVNMSMAIVAMTDTNDENAFDWSMQTQSVILSSFFWGYIVLQIPAGEIAARFGGSILVTIVVTGNAATSLLIPLAANYGGWQAVCACRVFQGVTQGFLYSSMHNLIGKWVPLDEKSRLGTFIYSGTQLGTALQLLISGYIAGSWGWPAIFYVNGTLGAIWTIAYIILGADSPQACKMISDEEKLYIQYSLGQVGEQKKLKTPWKAILTSLPFYALMITQSGHSWGLWTLMTEMPSYMKQILGVDIKAGEDTVKENTVRYWFQHFRSEMLTSRINLVDGLVVNEDLKVIVELDPSQTTSELAAGFSNGVISALPYLAMYVLSFPFGFISDYVLKKKWVGLSASRKISNTIGQWGPGFALIGLSYVPAGDVTLAVVLLTVVVGLNAGFYTGHLLVHIDMAPNFAGTVMGITNFFATVAAIIAPLIAGIILQDETDPNQWRQVFYISSAVYIVANLFFVIFGTSERQSWNEPEEIDNASNNRTEKSV